VSLQLRVSGDAPRQQLVRRHRAARRVGRHRPDDVTELLVTSPNRDDVTELEGQLLRHVDEDALTEVDGAQSVGKRRRLHRLAALWTQW